MRRWRWRSRRRVILMKKVPIQISYRKFMLQLVALRFIANTVSREEQHNNEDGKETEAPETKSSHSQAAIEVITLRKLRFGFEK
jgi:hypothetical protein